MAGADLENEDESTASPQEEEPEELDELVELGSSSAVHDRTQFESKFDFDLSGAGREEKTFEIEMYLFVPKSMG